MNVPTLAEVMDHLNVTSNDLAVEVDRTRLAAVAVVEALVGPLAPRTVVEVTRSAGGPVLVLREPPVIAVTGLQTSVKAGGTAEVLDVADLIVDGPAGVITYRGWLPTGPLEVTYTAGRPTDGLPADLFEAVLVQTAILWESQRSAGGARPLGAGGDPGVGLTPKVRRLEQLLAPHLLNAVVVV